MGSKGFLCLRVIENLICAQNGLKYRGMLEWISRYLWIPVEFSMFRVRSEKPELMKKKIRKKKRKKSNRKLLANHSEAFFG